MNSDGGFAEAGPVGHDLVAVSGLDVTRYEGQVFAAQCIDVGLDLIGLSRMR
jgi:hypothetical protein